MEWLSNLSGRKPKPPIFENDLVYPSTMQDNSEALKPLTMSYCFRFDDVLDADQLHEALKRLLEIGHWRKFGSRLRVKPGTKTHEFHAPREFTSDRPALRFSVDQYDVAMAEHPVAMQAAAPTQHPAVQEVDDAVIALALPPNAPRALEDFINMDVPLLCLHVVKFEDGTMVTITWPHTLSDGSGIASLFRNWGFILAGRDDVENVLEVDGVDLLYEAGDPSVKVNGGGYKDSMVLRGFSLLRFVVGYFWEYFTQKVELKTICMTKDVLEKLHQKASEDIQKGVDPRTPEEHRPFVSDNDVISAWIASTLASTWKNRPVTLLTSVDLRSRLPSLWAAKGVFVANMMLHALTVLPASLVQGTSFGAIARENRRQVTKETTLDGVTDTLQSLRTEYDSTGAAGGAFPGPANAIFMVSTNTLKFKLCQSIDFSPAISKPRRSAKGSVSLTPSGFPAYFSVVVPHVAFGLKNMFAIAGKDHIGNVSISVFFDRAVLKRMQEDLDELARR